MLTFIPRARKTFTSTYIATVVQRNAKGQMAGMASSGFTFTTAEAALAHAIACARRVSAKHPFTRVEMPAPSTLELA